MSTGSPTRKFAIAAVAVAVRGHKAFTAIPRSRNSSAIPKTHILIPYFDIVYATCGANHCGAKFNGGAIFKI